MNIFILEEMKMKDTIGTQIPEDSSLHEERRASIQITNLQTYFNKRLIDNP